jgi:hypothetical protein
MMGGSRGEGCKPSSAVRLSVMPNVFLGPLRPQLTVATGAGLTGGAALGLALELVKLPPLVRCICTWRCLREKSACSGVTML